jgi:hypothetical protein
LLTGFYSEGNPAKWNFSLIPAMLDFLKPKIFATSVCSKSAFAPNPVAIHSVGSGHLPAHRRT